MRSPAPTVIVGPKTDVGPKSNVFRELSVRDSTELLPTNAKASGAGAVSFHTSRPTGPGSAPASTLHEVIDPPDGTMYLSPPEVAWTESKGPFTMLQIGSLQPVEPIWTVEASAALGRRRIVAAASEAAITPIRAPGRNLTR